MKNLMQLLMEEMESIWVTENKEETKEGNGYEEDYDLLINNNFFIERVIYNNPVTVMFYRQAKDVNTLTNEVQVHEKLRKVVSKVKADDVYDKEIGLQICLNKMIKREAERNLKELYKGNK